MAARPIVHIEISSKDRDKTVNFFSEVFGWNALVTPGSAYALYTADNGPDVGFNPVSDDNPAGTVILYIQSADIDKDLEQIKKNGGKEILGKQLIPQTGWFAIFEDPTGNRLGLYTRLEQKF